jgi:glucose/mannose transport system permease protein
VAKPIRRLVAQLPLWIAAAGFLLPLALMLVTSFKSDDEVRTGTLLAWPHAPTVAAWIEAWSTACIGVTCAGLKGYFLNSLLIAVPAVAVSTIAGALNGYALTKQRFRGADTLFGLMLFGCFIPYQIIILPMARLLGLVGLASSLSGLVLVHVVYGLAFTTLFFRNFYVTIPDELIRAARIDGAGFFMTFRRIVLPLSPPIFVVAVIWQFTAIWNDFLFGAVFTTGDVQPMTVALNNLVNTSTGARRYNVDMAAALIAALPTLAVYVLAGKAFVRGLTAGAVKG